MDISPRSLRRHLTRADRSAPCAAST
jgi:hypothetical protein